MTAGPPPRAEPDHPPREPTVPGLLVVLAGPSGVGKGTVRERIFEALPEARLSVSVTTRDPRPGEREGVDYEFIDRAEFERRVAAGELLEWAEYVGNLYGTPRRQVEREVAAGSVVFLDIEVQGAIQVKQRVADALLVFLVPPSFDELERRLRGRATEDDRAVTERLRTARRELDHQAEFDVVVVNDDVERCARQVLEAIRTARSRLRGAR